MNRRGGQYFFEPGEGVGQNLFLVCSGAFVEAAKGAAQPLSRASAPLGHPGACGHRGPRVLIVTPLF